MVSWLVSRKTCACSVLQSPREALITPAISANLAVSSARCAAASASSSSRVTECPRMLSLVMGPPASDDAADHAIDVGGFVGAFSEKLDLHVFGKRSAGGELRQIERVERVALDQFARRPPNQLS